MSTSLQRTSLGELGYSSLTATSLGELSGITLPFTPVPVHPPGTHRDVAAWIKEEDEMLLAVIIAFLRIKDD